MGVVEGVHECIRQIVYLAHLLMHSLVVIAIGASTLSPTFDFESVEKIIIIINFRRSTILITFICKHYLCEFILFQVIIRLMLAHPPTHYKSQ